MQKIRVSRIATAALLILFFASTPAFAVNKDMVQLQTQVQQLLDAVARLQQSNDERMGVLKDLVQQSADSVNRMTQNMDALQKQLAAQQGAEGTKVDQVSGQVQALNDSLDEIKTRMNRLEKLLGSVESQQQNISATMQNMPQSMPQNMPPSNGPATIQPSTPTPSLATPPPGSALVDPPAAPVRRPVASIKSTAPPVEDLYKAAYSDYMSAKYAVAQSEFGDVIRSYPDNSLSGNSYYYLGEMDYRAGKYAAAAKDYDKVLEQFPDSNKIPASHLHKGQALIALKQNDAGVRELRTLIQRFPNSPEAAQARSRISGMGIPIKARP